MRRPRRGEKRCSCGVQERSTWRHFPARFSAQKKGRGRMEGHRLLPDKGKAPRSFPATHVSGFFGFSISKKKKREKRREVVSNKEAHHPEKTNAGEPRGGARCVHRRRRRGSSREPEKGLLPRGEKKLSSRVERSLNNNNGKHRKKLSRYQLVAILSPSGKKNLRRGTARRKEEEHHLGLQGEGEKKKKKTAGIFLSRLETTTQVGKRKSTT